MPPCVTPNTMPTGSRCCSQRTRCGKAPAWAGLRGARRSEASSEGRRGFSRSQSITASMARSRWKATRPKRDGTCLCLARRPPEIRRAHYMLRSDTSRQCAKRHLERNRRPLATRAPRIRLAILARCRAEGRPYGGDRAFEPASSAGESVLRVPYQYDYWKAIASTKSLRRASEASGKSHAWHRVSPKLRGFAVVDFLGVEPTKTRQIALEAPGGSMKHQLRREFGAALLIGLVGFVLPVRADDTIKIGYVDPFSGPFAAAGDQFLKVFAYILDTVNGEGGALGKKFEIVNFDDKLQPADALIALKSISDQNIPFVMHCVGSNVGAALIDGVSKHNARNPDNRVIYLNCGALATELTNEKCDFWHFRFSGDVEMRAYTRIKTLPKSVTSIYELNQDYLFGQSIQHDTNKYLAKLRPDIKVLADELMPFGKVQDFY